jgi:hypothetical protein
MNTTNNYSLAALSEMGVCGAVSTIEKWPTINLNAFKMCKGKRVLMTFAHCPNITLNNNDCTACSYEKSLTLKSNNTKFTIRRYRIANCYFELVDDVIEDRSAKYRVDDLRGAYV